MFYELIKNKRDQWYASPQCTAKSIVAYIQERGMMRNVQIEAIKTYLFLKIACHNKPLWQLFCEGVFNEDYTDFDFQAELLGDLARAELQKNGAGMALFQYSRLKDKNGKQLGVNLEKFIRSHAAEIDYEATFRKLFYGVSYTDYLFSLPMGAGKTFLMAAFIYLDLYLAQNEPDNPSFAHNFIILAPSGLKSSIVPSLKHIKEFDPTWVLPENAAAQVSRMISFEILDEQKSAAKSNRIKNPNAQKIVAHGIPEMQMGLVAITNAEKVILDRVDKQFDENLFSQDELNKIRIANELRHTIGKLNNLSILIDEVHHATDSDIKLRQVVSEWARGGSFCGVLGFSGTPYLETAEPIVFGEELTIKNTDLSNVVYYYPLAKSTGDFLKIPEVKYAEEDTSAIVRNGVGDFLKKFGKKKYLNGSIAKLAIYCGQIETLEETIYPIVAKIAMEAGMNPTEVILKYHGGNKQYPMPDNAEAEFSALDSKLSKIRFILLVQIGKEGWDCKSLTSVILPHERACKTNMVLQTSCRCLRQVDKGKREDALIWMNKSNADILKKQLLQQQNISLEEFTRRPDDDAKTVERFSRQHIQQVPPIAFYQLHVEFEDFVSEPVDTRKELSRRSLLAERGDTLVYSGDFDRLDAGISTIKGDDESQPTTFNQWLFQIASESFGTLTVNQLKTFEIELRHVFDKITRNGMTLPRYDHPRIRSLVRQAFLPHRDYRTRETEDITHAQLLIVENLHNGIDDGKFHPSQREVKEILYIDEHGAPPTVPQAVIDYFQKIGQPVPTTASHSERTQTYHYLPYHFDSRFEIDYFNDLLAMIKGKKIEAYFNGDDTLTQFRIKCYRMEGNHWASLGNYVPDFILLSRTLDGVIDKVMIVETKGEGYAAKFTDRRKFMETKFKTMNPNFDFLYIEDTMTKDEINARTLKAINKFFGHQ